MKDYISNFNNGSTRKQNLAYKSLAQRRYNYKDPAVRLALLKQIRSLITLTQKLRIMIYTRYADDFVILIIGIFHEAYKIRHNISKFLA